MPFQFRFSTTLALREHHRDESAAKCATIQVDLQQIEARRQEVSAARQELLHSLIPNRTKIISAQSIKSRQDYLTALQHEDDSLAEQQTDIASLLAVAEADLVTKHRAVAQLEKMLQREQSEHLFQSKRAEQREHDETAIARHHFVQR